MQEQKKYHQRKLAIIEMMEISEIQIKLWDKFIKEMPSELPMINARNQKARFERIIKYLAERYNR